MARQMVDPYAKTAVLARKAMSPGPTLGVALGWVGPSMHRQALISLFCGDWLLGRYSGNYFAKKLLPHRAPHLAVVQAAALEPSRVCLACWYKRRVAVLDDEGHVCIACPEHEQARTDLASEVQQELWRRILHAPDATAGLPVLLGSSCSQDWVAIGKFAARVRQQRRRSKQQFEYV